jgi:hypothetical protein
MDQKLYSLLEEAKVEAQVLVPQVLKVHNKKRLKYIKNLLASPQVLTGYDYYHAALMLKMSAETTEQLWETYEMALKAVKSNVDEAFYLAANIYDEWLLSQGKSQKFGTVEVIENTYYVINVDPNTTDEERDAWHVPPLAKIRQKLAISNEVWRPMILSTSGIVIMHYLIYDDLYKTNLLLRVIESAKKLDYSQNQFVSVDIMSLNENIKKLLITLFPSNIELRKDSTSFCVIASSLTQIVSWSKIKMPNNFVIDLSLKPGKTYLPQIEIVKIDNDQKFFRVTQQDKSYFQIVVRANLNEYWLVEGNLPSEQLIQIANFLLLC